MSTDIIKLDEGNFRDLYSEIINIINNSKQNLQRVVNSELILLYWNIGRTVKEEILKNQRAEYGKGIVDMLSQELTKEYGRGFGIRNIFRMIKFFEIFPDINIVSSLMAKLTWTHLIEIISIEEPVKRDFYITMCVNENWSVRAFKET